MPGGRAGHRFTDKLRTARLLRGRRNIGDFTRWKEHNAYQKALERLLRDLQVEAANPPA